MIIAKNKVLILFVDIEPFGGSVVASQSVSLDNYKQDLKSCKNAVTMVAGLNGLCDIDEDLRMILDTIAREGFKNANKGDANHPYFSRIDEAQHQDDDETGFEVHPVYLDGDIEKIMCFGCLTNVEDNVVSSDEYWEMINGIPLTRLDGKQWDPT